MTLNGDDDDDDDIDGTSFFQQLAFFFLFFFALFEYLGVWIHQSESRNCKLSHPENEKWSYMSLSCDMSPEWKMSWFAGGIYFPVSQGLVMPTVRTYLKLKSSESSNFQIRVRVRWSVCDSGLAYKYFICSNTRVQRLIKSLLSLRVPFFGFESPKSELWLGNLEPSFKIVRTQHSFFNLFQFF